MSDTPTGTQTDVLSPRRTLVSSTPAPDKPDVSQLFQKLGDKLGWFQYNNLDTAIETLSKSAKKKSTRSRREKTKQTDDTHTLQDTDCKPRTKHQKEKNQQKYDKEDECKENRKPREKKVKSHRTDSLHSSREVDEVFENNEEQGVPVRKSTACTDLTRSQTKHRKKHQKKPKPITPNSESPSVPQIKTHNIRLSSARSSSESPEYFGDNVTESTRIHSDASLECVLDSADVSAISFHRPDSVSGSTAMDSFRYNSNDDSYKLLNIKCDRRSNSPETSPTNVCVNLQALTIYDSNHDDSKGDKSLKTVSHSHLYTTAPCVRDDSVEVIESSCNSHKDTASSGSSYEVQDVSVQVQTHSEEETEKHKLYASSSGSSYEVEDVSVQADEQLDGIKSISPKKNQHQCFNLKSDSSEKDEDGSYFEVEDTSMQTSIQFSPESQTIPDVDVESESVVTRDHSPEKQADSILDKLHDISLPELDFDTQPKPTFPKRDPSIYFDAIDAAKLATKFSRRDPSIYFDAKQSLLSDSHSSSSSTGQTHSPTKDPIGPGAKGDNRVESDTEIPSGVISLSDSDLDQVEKSPKIVKKKHRQYNSFSSDSENDFKSKYFSKNKSKVKSQRKYSSSADSSDSDYKSQKRGHHVPRSTVVSKEGSQYHKDKSDSSPPDSNKVSGQLSNKHWRTKQTIDADSSSDDEALETFFQKMRGSKKQLSSEEEEEENNDSMNDFIVDDPDVSEDEDDIYYISTAYKTSFVTKEDQKKILPIVFQDSSSEDEDFKTPRVTSKRNDDQVFKTPISTKKKPRKLKTPSTDMWGLKEDNCLYHPSTKYSFLKSLTENLPPHKCDPEAIRFIKTFKKSKQELTQHLFKLFNETVFESKLPDDLDVIWNCRLLKTAGCCVYKKVSTSGGARTVRIELSTKVCDSAERVRDTLIHEMCHAAVWLVNGKTDGHGPYWRYWAKKSNQTHPEIPVIGRCHSYSINTKFTYQCSQCGYRIGRHSKSLNTDIKVCGYCHGRFVLLSNTGQSGSTPGSGVSTPRTPNKFALFVKDNYGDVKKREHNLKHKDIMKILSQEFAKSKISG